MAETGGEPKTSSGAPEPSDASAGTPTVFISYASQDKAVADVVCRALERAGVACWIAPRDVVPGEFYAEGIIHAIDAAKVVVLVLSENAAASLHVLREVERASSKRHPVICFRTDLAPLPAALEYFLNTSHWLDASTSGVERALPKLVEAVQRLVSPASVVQPGQPGAVATPVSEPLPAQARQRLSRPVIALSAVIALGLVCFAADEAVARQARRERAPNRSSDIRCRS